MSLPVLRFTPLAAQRIACDSGYLTHPSGQCVAAAEPLQLQTIGFRGQEERIMRYVLALLAAVNAWGIMPACSEESEPGVSLASLDNIYTVGSTQNNGAEPDRNTALTKEGEFESPETIAAIEKNREDRERTVVMDR
jgi:hypothetical protein